MTTKTLTVTAQVRAKPGKETEVRQQLLSLVEPSRRDRGCIDYELHESVEKPGTFIFYENWSCKADLDAHLKQPHVTQVLSKLGELAEAEIGMWERIA